MDKNYRHKNEVQELRFKLARDNTIASEAQWFIMQFRQTFG